MRRILLIEPSYRNKYPPLGLMKISAYHKMLGDEVVFCKGTNPSLRQEKWDRIYITSLFTFYWNTTIKTIKYYLKSVDNTKHIFVGGPMATIMAEEILAQKGLEEITILRGLLNKPNMLDENEHIVDNMVPDYSIIDTTKNDYLTYNYPVSDAFFIHSTRGCIRKCEFCAVPKIEPNFKKYVDIKPNIENVIKQFGDRRDLMIMDNNILASPDLEQIIQDIIDCGFGVNNNDYKYIKDGKERTKKRYVDFNQGLDARLLYEHPEKMQLLSRVAVKPLRIAFDHADDEFVKIYTRCMWLAAENNIKDVSNYILFNFEDEPNDLYKRLEINVLLNTQFENAGYRTRIWSFPMRFSPIFGEEAKGRKFLGKKWVRKQLRGIQCILNATHGIVGPKHAFFKKAFGENIDEFNKLIWMPEKYIIYRNENIENGNTDRWNELFCQLDTNSLAEFKSLIGDNIFVDKRSDNRLISKLLSHYTE
jgi:hypothetical protein